MPQHVVLGAVVPGCAPAGRALIATSETGEDRPGRESGPGAALADAYGADTGGWTALTYRTVCEALPAMPRHGR